MGARGVIARIAAGVPMAIAAALLTAGAPAAASVSPVSITVRASATQIASGSRVTLSGAVSGLPAGSTVRLYDSPYPFPVAKLAAITTTGPTGSYGFVVSPDRDTRYRVLLPGTSATELAEVDVTGRTITKVKALPLGRARVTLIVFHPRDLEWGTARVAWSFTEGTGRFVSFPATRAVRLSPYVAVLSTTATLPAGRFSWRACMSAPGDEALANPRRPPGCAGRGYYGAGSLPVGFPGPASIARAERYLASRGGHTALAVVDIRGPALRGALQRPVHHRQRRQGDAAGRVPAPARCDASALHRFLQRVDPVSR